MDNLTPAAEQTLENVKGFIAFIFSWMNEPIILGIFSLWNVFQGMFGFFVFRMIVMDGVLNWKHENVSKYVKTQDKAYTTYNSKKRR